MRPQVGRVALLCFVAVATVSAAAPAFGQVSDHYSFALMFLKRAYPMVEQQRWVASMESEMEFGLHRAPMPLRSFAMVVRRGPADHRVSAELGPVEFRALFHFDIRGRFDGFSNAGSEFVNQTKGDTLGGLFISNPLWRKDEIAAAVRAAGAGFGPDEEGKMISEVRSRLAALAGLLGETKIVWHQFNYDSDPGWVFQARRVRVPRVTYQLIFEPFEGRLLGIGRL